MLASLTFCLSYFEQQALNRVTFYPRVHLRVQAISLDLRTIERDYAVGQFMVNKLLLC
jgi:hypothetical protein